MNAAEMTPQHGEFFGAGFWRHRFSRRIQVKTSDLFGGKGLDQKLRLAFG
jgi:hypothetical protein